MRKTAVLCLLLLAGAGWARAQEEAQNHSFEHAAVKTVKIDTVGGALRITEGKTLSVGVDNSDAENCRTAVTLGGEKTLYIKAERKSEAAACLSDIVLTLPADKKIFINASGTSVFIDGLKDLHLSLASGGAVLQNMAGTLEIKNISSEITAYGKFRKLRLNAGAESKTKIIYEKLPYFYSIKLQGAGTAEVEFPLGTKLKRVRKNTKNFHGDLTVK